MEKRVIVILGPTCSGKTSLSLLLAKSLNSEVISADSRQIYKVLSIGTAKPTELELKIAKHHFVDLLNPDEDYNVSRFEIEALKIIDEIHKLNKIPIVVGGSGLYIKAIVEGLWNDVDTDSAFRQKLMEEKEEFGNQFLYDKLVKVDSKSAETMLPQNYKRVIRALEVFHLTGKSLVDFHQEHKRKSDYVFYQFGLDWKREVLYNNIDKRVDEMIQDGLVDEVKSILEMGYSPELNSLNTVGYKEIISYLNGEYDIERAIELIKRNTRRFAKRQLTWFRKDENIKWFAINDKNEIPLIADAIIGNFR
ncbi:MAG: tRNA (adenosine(37)-N6)-dimethylallyltransferase MiaA [Bacteroidetes bacterium]|nr:tRNA (adenosine(37)-N6)-dimethylallyltransferase MiaA [Bacteroidota bacterium]MBU1115301.1 tRNA (adenosine(37)-N6)-dimethylallyltransferase MiaA [Bacteroidota bacterium]MBU1799586.1 tRNA (adenosine(37)-N6)-dimethylallyltransferase MiaA [Bacteroidota bacterium]